MSATPLIIASIHELDQEEQRPEKCESRRRRRWRHVTPRSPTSTVDHDRAKARPTPEPTIPTSSSAQTTRFHSPSPSHISPGPEPGIAGVHHDSSKSDRFVYPNTVWGGHRLGRWIVFARSYLRFLVLYVSAVDAHRNLGRSRIGRLVKTLNLRRGHWFFPLSTTADSVIELRGSCPASPGIDNVEPP